MCIGAMDDTGADNQYCESDADDTLIIKIPFTASVSIRSITIKAGPSGQTPRELHIVRPPSLNLYIYFSASLHAFGSLYSVVRRIRDAIANAHSTETPQRWTLQIQTDQRRRYWKWWKRKSAQSISSSVWLFLLNKIVSRQTWPSNTAWQVGVRG